MAGQIRVVPVLIGGAAGGLDGVLMRSKQKRFAVWLEGAYLVLGAGLGMFGRVSPDITDPLMHSGATLLGLRAALKFSGGGAYGAANGYPAMVELGAPQPAYAGAQLSQPAPFRREPVGLTG